MKISDTLKDKIKKALALGQTSTWIKDSNDDEMEVDDFDQEIALREILKVLEDES